MRSRLLSCVSALFVLFFFAGAQAHASTTVTTQIIAASSGQCLTPASGATSNGTLIVQQPCTTAAAMNWSVVQVGSTYQLVSQASGLCLNVNGASTSPGAQLIEWTCQAATAGANDKWTLNSTEDGSNSFFQLTSTGSNLCAAVSGASLATGTNLVQWTCSDATDLSQQFYLAPTALPTQQTPSTTVGSAIMNANSGQCLQTAGGSTAVGASVVQNVCTGSVAEAWSLAAIGSNFHIVSQSSGQCLNVYGNSNQQGTQLIQWPCQNASVTNDQWQLVSVQSPAGTFYHLVAQSSGQCANINGASTATGAGAIEWPCQPATTLNDQFFVGPAATTAKNGLPSAWSSVIPVPVNPVAVANLPNGNLLFWSANSQFNYEGDIGSSTGQAYYATFNPATGVTSQALANTAGADLFCPGTTVLPNGNILVNGGSSSPKTTLYNVSNGQWQADAAMNIPRGYGSTTLLSNRSAFTFGGSWSGGGAATKNGEMWTSGQGWSLLNNTPDTGAIGPDPQGIYRGDNHMWLFAQSNGMVFQAGPSAQMNWIGTSSSGSIQSAGNRGNDPFSINGNAVLYDVGKILKVGGAIAYQQDSGTPTYATTSAYTIDITGGPSVTPVVKQISSMNYGRSFGNSVVLPSGDVVVLGGQSIPNPFTDTGAVLVPELWNHTSQSFTALNPMQIPRTYHSSALLLPDGRVFSGGGGQCGYGCADNHLSVEILTPPYLLNSDGSAATRPAITSAPAQAKLGSTIKVTTDTSVSSFALMRLSATTHTVNNDQRRIPLVATPAASGSGYSLAIPADPGVVLPGYYMLFALNAKGVPSVSVTVQVP